MKIAVWLLRIIVGATFVFSGFSKAVDPWGFMLKLEEYMHAWDLAPFSRELMFCAAVAIAMLEFVSGVLLITGCLKRLASWTLMAMMCVLLPLTGYIAISSPVEDCGCFGDAWKLSNTATFIKNIILTAMLGYLVVYNTRVNGLYRSTFQWVVITASVIYCLILSLIGYMVQPMVDFRPYKTGTMLVDDNDMGDITLIYAKDGQEKEFSMYELPDSSWTYVGRRENADASDKLLAIYDGDEDVTPYAINSEGNELVLMVSDPDYHSRARASMANRLNEYMQNFDGRMICLLPLKGEQLTDWEHLSHPEYEVYTAENTTLKEIARGEAALMYLKDGVIQWKLNLYSLPGDFPTTLSDPGVLDRIKPIDTYSPILKLTGLYALVLMIPMIMNFAIRQRKRISDK